MIAALTGKIFESGTNPLIVMVGGVGYAVSVPALLIGKLKKEDKVTLFVHTHVREDALELFGFLTREELDLFHHLLSVSGIGPKTAIAVVDRGVADVTTAVQKGDVDFFTTIPRLGRKNAQKIIIELKNKLGSTSDLDLTENPEKTKELLSALMSMGFKQAEIRNVIKQLAGNELSLEQKVRKALQQLGKP